MTLTIHSFAAAIESFDTDYHDHALVLYLEPRNGHGRMEAHFIYPPRIMPGLRDEPKYLLSTSCPREAQGELFFDDIASLLDFLFLRAKRLDLIPWQ